MNNFFKKTYCTTICVVNTLSVVLKNRLMLGRLINMFVILKTDF